MNTKPGDPEVVFRSSRGHDDYHLKNPDHQNTLHVSPSKESTESREVPFAYLYCIPSPCMGRVEMFLGGITCNTVVCCQKMQHLLNFYEGQSAPLASQQTFTGN